MDHLGVTSALSTLSPIVPERVRDLKNRLRVVRYTPGLGRPLLQLGFIHYARWIIVDWLPSTDGSGGWQGLRSRYLLFESSYDGTQAEYLRTFADIVPLRLAKLWGACFGFEREVERAAAGRIVAPGRFQSFVRENQLQVLDFYAAYPNATAIDVRQAIDIDDLMAAASDHPDGEESELRRVEAGGSMSLGPVSGPLTLRERVEAIYEPWKRAVLGRYGVNPLTVVTPISDTDASGLRDA